MNTTIETEITEDQVKAWMLARLAECIKITPRGPVQFEVKANNFASGLLVVAQCYNESIGHGRESESVEIAFASFREKAGQYAPKELAKKKRNEAARLIAEAEQLETQAANL